ncbi:hypothetical protein H0X48_04780 [Candidatus Dependentiae bacterium]|nr:hypothetical protein [Candidatus Dependentiae bacterium]
MKLRYIVALLSLNFCSLTVRADELHEAITQINVERVKDLLDKKEHFTHDEKKRLEKFAHAVTKDAKYRTKSVWRSGEDMAHVFAGRTFMIGGSVASLYALSKAKDNGKLMLTSLGCWAASLVLGHAWQRRGLHLHNARAWHKKARQIESLIADKHAHHHHHN